jgi:pimeloyl-ACP methyl ester carboxylesterase
MNETAHCLGSGDVLVAILTEPDGPVDGDVPAVILLNAGIVHRSGPSRLYVEITRRLASRGYPSIRLDLAGIGDSDVRQENLTDQEGNERDVRLAMDFLQSRFGTRHFLLAGLCSGADIAHQVAVRDERVVGLIALDAIAYPKFGYYIRRFSRWVRNPAYVYHRTCDLLRSSAIGRALLGPLNDGHRAQPLRMFERDLPPQSQVAAEIQVFLDRGMQALYVFAGGCPWYNYAGQFFNNFPHARCNPQVELEYFPQADHTYFLVADRDRLVDRIETWVSARFPQGQEFPTDPELPTDSVPAESADFNRLPAVC